MLELFEVFDAPTQVLQDELRSIKIAMPDAHGYEKTKLQQLRETIQQELDERGTSSNVMDQLLPILQSANPDTWASDAPALMAAAAAAPGNLQQELLELVQAGQRIAASRQQGQGPAAQAASSPAVHQHQPHASSTSATTTVNIPGQRQEAITGNPATAVHTQAGAVQVSAGAEGTSEDVDGEEGDDDDGGDDVGEGLSPGAASRSAAPSKPISVQEAALAAFKEEQRKLHKARKAIHKGPAKPAVSRQELAAVYRGPPPAASAPAVTASPARPHAQSPHSVQEAPAQQLPREPLQQAMALSAAADAPATATVLAAVPTPATPRQDGKAASTSNPNHIEQAASTQRQEGQYHAAPSAHSTPGHEVIYTQSPRQQHQQEAGSRPVSSGLPATAATSSAIQRPALGAVTPSTSAGVVQRPASARPAHAGSPATGSQLQLKPSMPQASKQEGLELQSEASSTEYASEGEESPAPKTHPKTQQPDMQAGPSWQPPAQAGGYMHARISPRGGPGMPVDRWSEWDLDNDQGVSAWGRETEDDAVVSHLQSMPAVPRAAGHVPPQILPQGAYLGTGRVRPLSTQPVITAQAGIHGSQGAAQACRSPVRSQAAGNDMNTSSEEESSSQASPSPSKGRAASPDVTPPAAGPSAGGAVQHSTSAARSSQQLVPAGAVLAGRPSSATPPVAQRDVAPDPVSSTPRPPKATEQQATPSQASQPSQAAGSRPKASTPRPISASPLRPGRLPAAGSTAVLSGQEAEAAPGAVYTQHFNAFHDVLSVCYSLPSQVEAAAGYLGPKPAAFMFSGTDVLDKYQGLMLRIGAWLEAEQTRANKGQASPSPSMSASGSRAVTPASGARTGSEQVGMGAGLVRGVPTTPRVAGEVAAGLDAPLVRYFTVADDTLHPEVREVVTLALAGLPGWAPDPMDQVTEVGKPDPFDDDAGPDAGVSNDCQPSSSQGSQSSPPAAAPAAAAHTTGVPMQQRSPLAGRCNMWNLLWSWSVKARPPQSELLTWQRFNHFPEARQLSRKDLLKKHLVRYQVMHGGNARLAHLFSSLPTTYVLPKEAPTFYDAFQKAMYGVEPSVTQPKGLNLWIVKPVGLSRGRGIRLVRSLREIGDGPGSIDEPLVVQRYVTNPLTVQGCKFDLRLYVLVTSFNPLEAWLCREGFARFATLPFTLDEAELGNRFVHLTNSSVQKVRAAQGQLPAFLADAIPAGGSKCSLTRLRQLLAEQRISWDPLWSRIQEVVTGCLFAAQDAIPACVNAFELFGFDVLLDTAGGVWVLEVNGSPSLSLDTPLDRAVKPRMLRDAIAIVDPLPFDREALLEVLAARTSSRGRLTRRPAPGNMGGGLMAGTVGEERGLMCSDLQQVLRGKVMRKYGEAPAAVAATLDTNEANWFQCLAPSPLLDKLSKLKKPLGP